MAWRNQGITGSNNIPLGKVRRFAGGDSEDGHNNDNAAPPAAPSNGFANDGHDLKRGRSPESKLNNHTSPKAHRLPVSLLTMIDRI